MEVGYAFLFLFIYVVTVILTIWLYDGIDQYNNRKKPVKLPVLTDKEKRRKLNELIAPFGFAYDGNQNIFYSRMDSWQRQYGYGRIYDEAAAPLNMIMDCEPIYFEYDNKKWMIEFWKGQYGITTGGEVGIYYLPKNVVDESILPQNLIYQCVTDEDTLKIQTILWKKEKQLYYRRGYHWWMTGFVLGEYSKPKELEMDIEITMKDRQMRDAFLNGLYEAGYTNNEMDIQGNRVWIRFTKPHTKQPVTKIKWFSIIKQMENKRNCKLFHKATGEYANAYDKVQVLKIRAPKIYKKMESLEKGRIISGEY